MRLFYSGVSNSNDPRVLVPGIDVMQAFDLSFRKREEFDRSCFLDSGAFALRKFAKGADPWAYYRSQSYRDYLDAYAAFVRRFDVQLYANVDVIGNPELTYRNQRYLERVWELRPVPVVHFRTHLDWLKRYVDEGYDLIGLGGLVGSAGTLLARDWIGRAFGMVSNGDGTPRVRFHGFGLVNYSLLTLYPWWSVDSAAALKESTRGVIFVPHYRGGFTYLCEPYKLRVSGRPSKRKNPNSGAPFVEELSPSERSVVVAWLDGIGVPNDNRGVVEEANERYRANLLFFEWVRGLLPEYPWPLRRSLPVGLGVV